MSFFMIRSHLRPDAAGLPAEDVGMDNQYIGLWDSLQLVRKSSDAETGCHETVRKFLRSSTFEVRETFLPGFSSAATAPV
jgi:hypothetical protein